ncbi:MAG: MGMT family protein [Nitrospinota bacterium]|nr:MGMT family protein [Nitrospinota bacterium]
MTSSNGRNQPPRNAKSGPGSRPPSGLEGAAFRTAFGWAGAVATARGLRRLILHLDSREQVEAELRDLNARLRNPPNPLLRRVIQSVRDYFEGEPVALDFDLDLSDLSPFSRRVTRETRKIGWGRVRTYGQVAAAAGSPGAARAVGVVMAKNRLPLAVP